jgi:hypothetical protein
VFKSPSDGNGNTSFSDSSTQADFSYKKVLLIKTSLVKLTIGASRVKADVFINGKTCLKRFEKAHNVLYIVVPVLECPLHNILFQNSKMTTM